jgi:2-polyprenyl-3-methyl-5-hydroxy-6-metoxy-1,4-benzoquinol methylase
MEFEPLLPLQQEGSPEAMIKGLERKLDFERMFVPEVLDALGDQWLTKWRGSQQLRLGICLGLAKGFIRPDQHARVLDIGCGLSDWLLKLHRTFPSLEYYGTDISDNAVRWNQKHYPFIQYKQCALPEVGFARNTFDFISALEVVYYLEEQQRLMALRNMAATLKPGGYLLISGVLDGGKSYFAEDRIVQAVAEILSVERIAFNYARCYTWLERRLLGAYHVFDTARQLIDLLEPVFQQRLAKKKGWRTRIAPVLRLPMLRPVGKAGSLLAVRLLRMILRWVWLPSLCYRLTKTILRDRGRTQIVILGKRWADRAK